MCRPTTTIATADGRTVTSNSLADLLDAIDAWCPAPEQNSTSIRLANALFAQDYKLAGEYANRLGLSFAFAPEHATDAYLVPEDPAAAIDTDCCQ